MSIKWLKLDGDITRLYVNEDKSLEDTLQYLYNKYNVKITPRQFKRKYSGLKNLRAIEWKAIIGEIAKRETENKQSEVFFNGRKLDSARIERAKQRYGNVCETVESRANIDLGTETVGKHRIEIRSPQRLSDRISSRESYLVRIPKQRPSISVETGTVDDLGMISHDHFEYDLHLADLSTPRLETSLVVSSPMVSSQIVKTNTKQIHSNGLALGCERDFIAAMSDGFVEEPSFRQYRSIQTKLSPLNQQILGCHPQFSYASQAAHLPLPIFLGSPDVFRIIANLQSSKSLSSANLKRLSARSDVRLRLISPFYEVKHPATAWGSSSSHLVGIGTFLRVPKQVLILAEGILSKWDVPSLSSAQEIHSLIHDHGQQLPQLLFSIVAHLCCNNLMPDGGLASFLDWLSRMGILEQFGIFLRGNSIATHAFVDEFARELNIFSKRAMEYGRIQKKDMSSQVSILLDSQNIQLTRRMAGRLLHAIATTHWVELGKRLVAQGADLEFEKSLTGLQFFVSEHLPKRSRFDVAKSCAGTPLFQAIVNRKVGMVKYLIKAGCNIKGVFQDELTGKSYNALGLCLSSHIPSVDIAELLVSAGCEFSLGFNSNYQQVWDKIASPSKSSQQLRNKIHLSQQQQKRQELGRATVDAAAFGNQALSTFLLQHEIFEEVALEYVLRIAVEENRHAAVRTLLQRGINPNAPKQLLGNRILGGDGDLEERTPIQLAGCEENYEVIYMLHKAGAKFDEKTWAEIKPRVPYGRKNTRWLELMLALMASGLDPSRFGPSVLEIAVHEESVMVCGLLLDLGVPIDAYGEDGQTALQRAASLHDMTLMQFLLDQGADVNVPAYQDNGRTALQAAAESLRYDSTETIENLLNAGADIRAPPAAERGLTVLEAVANPDRYYGNTLNTQTLEDQFFLFKRLLSLGALINRPSGGGSNILHGLISSGSYDCLNLALHSGAQVDDRSLPKLQKREERERGGDMTPLQYAALRVDAEAIHALLKHGADVNAAAGKEFGRTALQAVATSGPNKAVTEIVDLLLSHGADVNAPPARKGGITALQGAVSTCDFEAVKTLLAHGADVNAPGAAEEGRTALEIAAEWGRLDMVRFLLSKGAVPDSVRGYSSAIELAEENDSWVVAEFLRNESILNPLDPGLWNMDFSDAFQSMPILSSDFMDILMEEFMQH